MNGKTAKLIKKLTAHFRNTKRYELIPRVPGLVMDGSHKERGRSRRLLRRDMAEHAAKAAE